MMTGELDAFLAAAELTPPAKVWAWIFLAALAAGILKSLHITRRPGTNTKCVLSLVIILATFVFNLLVRLFKPDLSDFPLTAMLFLVIVVVLWTVCLVFAVMGLVEMAKHTAHFNQGKKQAIAAILLCAGSVILVASRFPARGEDSLAKMTTSDTVAGGRVELPEFNLFFEVPPAPWVRVDVSKLNPEACLGFLRMDPAVTFVVIAETADADLTLDAGGIAEVLKAGIRSKCKNSRVAAEREESHAGLPGVLLEHEARQGFARLHLVHWAAFRNGFLYQLNAFGRESDADAVRAAAQDLFDRFGILDPALAAEAGEVAEARDLQSPHFGYSVRLAGSGWIEWSADTSVRAAEFKARRGYFGRLAVVPVSLEAHDPSSAALNQALLHVLNIDVQEEELSALGECARGGLRGAAYAYERTSDDISCLFRLEALRKERFACLVAAWVLKDRSDSAQVLEEGLSLVSFPADPALPPPDALPPHLVEAQALVLNKIGVYYYRNDQFAEAVDYFVHATDLDPKDVDYLVNALRTFNQLERRQEALDLIADREELFRDNHQVVSWKPFLLHKLGRQAEAAAAYALLFDAGYRDDEDLETYAASLRALGRDDDALSAAESYAAVTRSARAHRFCASLHAGRGDRAVAIERLQSFQKEGPFDGGAAADLETYLFEEERYNESIDLCNDLIARGLAGGDVYFRRGRSEYRLNWYRQAKASFEAALEANPTDQGARDYLEHLAGVLGEGDASLVKDPIGPVALPPELAAPPAEALASDQDTGASARYLLRATAVSFRAKKEFRFTEYRRVKVFDQAGRRIFSSFDVEFDPLAESIYVNEVTVRDETGEVAARGAPADLFVLDRSSEAASQKKTLTIPVPGLQPGSTLELAYTVRRHAPCSACPFLERRLYAYDPTCRSLLYLCGDVGDIRGRCSAGVSVMEDGHGGICWYADDTAGYRRESLADEPRTFMPEACIGDVAATWESVARDYLAAIEERLAPSPEVEALAAELVAGRDGAAVRTAALALWLQREVAYKAIEFGSRAVVPAPVEQVLANRYGDCKEHSLLLHHLLRAAGVESHLALMSTAGSLWQEAPSLDQFDHMIVFIPGPEGGHFIDAADKFTDPMLPVPDAYGDRPALILDPARPRLEPIPPYPAGSSKVVCRRQLEIAPGGEVAVDETLVLHGYYAASMRRFLAGMDPDASRGALEGRMRGSGYSLEVNSLDVLDLQNTSSPLEIRMSYRVERCFQAMDGKLAGSLPIPWECYYWRIQPSAARTGPVRVRYPDVLESSLVVTTGAMQPAAGVDALTREGRSDFCTWSTSGWAGADGLHVTMRAELAPGRYPAERFAEFERSVNEPLRVLARQIVFAPEN